jgi:fatty acid CoA ligase FadD9
MGNEQIVGLDTKVAAEDDKGRRMEKLRAEDPQFRDSYPLKEVLAAKTRPGLRLAQVVQIVMEGYADRPALGQRARIGDGSSNESPNPPPFAAVRNHDVP